MVTYLTLLTPTRTISPPNTSGSIVSSGAEAYKSTNTKSGKSAIVPAELLNRVKPSKEAYATLLTNNRIQLSVRHICKNQGYKYLMLGPDLNKRDEKGMTALCQAARNNDIETFHLLRKVRANLDATDKKGRTALMHAASSNHTGFIKALINAGANLDATDRLGNTALMLATIRRKTEAAIELIQRGINLDATDDDGDTALLIAAQKDDRTDIVKALIEGGADLDVTDKHVITALMMAIFTGSTCIAKALIEGGADLDTKDQDGKTALMYAAMLGNTQLVKALIEAGADLNVRSDFGTALFIPALNYNKLERSINRNCHSCGRVVDVSSDTDTDLDVDSVPSPISTVEGIFEDVPLQDDLNENFHGVAENIVVEYPVGDSVNRKFNNNAFDKIFNVLIKSGINPYIKNNNGQTALDILRTKLEKRGITVDEVQSKMQLILKLSLKNLCRQFIRSQIHSFTCFSQLPLSEIVKAYIQCKSEIKSVLAPITPNADSTEPTPR